jgi:hypothetical protein
MRVGAVPSRITTTAGLIFLALGGCTPALDNLRGRPDREEAIVPTSAALAATCVADSAARAGGEILETNEDPELTSSFIIVRYKKFEGGGPDFNAWYQFSPRDGKNARVVYTFDAAAPYRPAARDVVLGPIKACAGGPVSAGSPN